MISKQKVKDPKKPILTACIKMFIEKGFKQTMILSFM
mgnify:FL=1